MKDYIVQSQTSEHVMRLLQMGADVKVVSGSMVYVSFDINSEFQVSYVYHMNKKNRYFLTRIKPYPIPIREFDKQEDIIRIINIDIEQFRNAIGSRHINHFVETNYKLHEAMLKFEDLFLYYNVCDETIEKVQKHIYELIDFIETAPTISKRVYFGKDPDNLKK